MTNPKQRYKFQDRSADNRLIISVDGEGKNLPFNVPGYVHPDEAVSVNGWHTYTLLAASDDRGESGRHASISGPYVNREPDGTLPRNYGLSTADCLKFLTSLPDTALVVSFYFSYDVTKLTADLPRTNLRELASGHVLPADGCDECAGINRLCPGCYRERVSAISRKFQIPTDVVKSNGMIDRESTIWGNYWITYIPRKKLKITDLSKGRSWVPADKRYKWNNQVIVWDVFGFFQKAFVEALRDAKGICPVEIVDRIAAMKDQRGDFAKLDDEQILAYCYEECFYLSKLVRDMLQNLERFGLRLNAYDGTGAIARAWMGQQKIRDYKSDTNLPIDIALNAYFGGRFEVSELGYMGRLYSHDINSAYPNIAATLPCLAHGSFRHLEPDANGHVEYVPGKFGVYLAGSKTTGRFAPFPFRIDDKRAMAHPELIHPKSVYYAHGGKRWIWANANENLSEIGIARKHFGTDAIPLYDGWVWEPECDHVPFGAIPGMYAERRRLKADGPGSPGYDGIEKVIKLLLNSIYGKTAQSVGTTVNPDGSYKFPQYTSFVWAGLITSGTRAMILDAVMQGDVVSIATDGILSRVPLDNVLTLSKELGDWDDDIVEDAYLFQSGVYTMLKPCKPGCKHPDTVYMNEHGVIVHEPFRHEITSDGRNATRVFKTRGFSRKEIPARKLIDAWDSGDPDRLSNIEPEPDSTRFVPFKAGVIRNDAFDMIGQWVKSNHKVTISHNRRIPDVSYDDITGLPVENIGRTYGSMPYTFEDDDMSAPYTLKETWEDMDNERDGTDDSDGDYLEWIPEPDWSSERG